MVRILPDKHNYSPPTEPWLDVIYEDEHLLVLNKPSGLLSVAGKTQDLSDCLEERVKETYPEATVVHRLDMSTSGVIIMARTRAAHRNLSLQFEKRQTAKMYEALVWGQVREERGYIDLPMRCDWPNRPKQIVDHEFGREAITEWEVKERLSHATRVSLYPLTGRSHQLRVHMLSLGHPILGDEFYAHDSAFYAASRLMLHAAQIEVFDLKNEGKKIIFKASCPF